MSISECRNRIEFHKANLDNDRGVSCGYGQSSLELIAVLEGFMAEEIARRAARAHVPHHLAGLIAQHGKCLECGATLVHGKECRCGGM